MLRYLQDVSTLALDRALCTGCGTCRAVCPQRVFRLEGKKAQVGDRDACMECGACAMNCAEGAITVRKGVGCAAALIGAALGRRDAACC